MGIYKNKDFAFYISPKTGGTTIRSWLVFSETDTLEIENNGNGYVTQNGIGQQLITNMGYWYKGFKEVNSSCKVCVKRDPVSRFLSCYTDKILRERIVDLTIDDILNDWDTLKTGREDPLNPGTYYLANHFLPQTYYLGENKNYYDLVFDVKEVGTKVKTFLEKKLEIELPKLHTRKQSKKPEVNGEQIEKIKEIYAIDYKNGWC
jgi:hypothetical protein